MRWNSILPASRSLLAAGLFFAGVWPLAGATQSWTGTVSPDWMDAGNWSSGVAPVPGDNLGFTLGNLNNRSNFNNYASGTTFGQITIFDGATVEYILAGAPIILTNGISASGAISSLAPVIDFDINLNSITQTFSASHSLVFNGNIALGSSANSVGLTLDGSGTIIFNGAISGGIDAGISKTNTGTLILSSNASFQALGITVDAGLCTLDGAATNASENCYVFCVSSYGPATLQGTGVVDQILLYGLPYNGGTLSPGDNGPGVLQCKVANLSYGTLLERINGTTPGSGYSQLMVTSNYFLAQSSTINCLFPQTPAELVLSVGYDAQPGDSFQIIQGPDERSIYPPPGMFDRVPIDGVAESTNGYSFGVTYTNGVNLTTLRRPDSPFVLWSGNASYYYFSYIPNVAWSSTNNWAQGLGPSTGSRLQFTKFQYRSPSPCADYNPPPQTNDLAAGFSLDSLLFTGTNYVLYGNPITVTEGITNDISQGTNWCYLPLVTIGPLAFDGDAGGTFVLSNSFNGSGMVRKEGGGRLVYAGTTMNSFVGSVVVDSGEFRANGSFTDGSFVVNGGLLTGTGTVSSVTMNGGTLLPGASPGILHVQGGLTMTPGAVFQVELNGPTPGNGYDQLEVNGPVNLNGATLSVLPGFAITPGTAFLVLVNDSSYPLSGTFAGLPEGATFKAGGQYFSISYKAGPRSNVLLLTCVIPASPQGNFSGITSLNPGTIQLQGVGGSNVAYTIQANTNLATTNWVNIGVATSDNSGVFSFDVSNVFSFPEEFFRVQTP